MRIETAAARGRPPSGRVERRARAATRGGGLTIDVLAYGIDSGAFSTAAATGAAPVCSSTALRQTAAAFLVLELQSPAVADAFIHRRYRHRCVSASLVVQVCVILPRFARKAANGEVGAAVAAVGECAWVQLGAVLWRGCTGGSSSLGTARTAACMTPPQHAYCARCGGVVCVGGRRLLRRVGVRIGARLQASLLRRKRTVCCGRVAAGSRQWWCWGLGQPLRPLQQCQGDRRR